MNGTSIQMPNVKISRYSLFKAMFRAQEEGSDNIVDELNRIINIFCDEERKECKNIEEMQFNTIENEEIIQYINTLY